MNKLNVILAAGLMTVSAGAFAQVCKEGQIREATSADQFVNHNDGTVSDVETGLVWSLCSEGQIYADGECSGVANSYTWTEGLNRARVINNAGGIAGKTGWRLPNIKELGSIVESQCYNPAINLSVFPDTPSATYWSSTPDPRGDRQARSIYFKTGSDLSPSVSRSRHVRMVRDAN